MEYTIASADNYLAAQKNVNAGYENVNSLTQYYDDLGESEPVEKVSSSLNSNYKNPLELENLAFMGSNVISGSAVAIVINIGDSTIFGSIAKDLSSKKVVTSFEKGINSVYTLYQSS